MNIQEEFNFLLRNLSEKNEEEGIIIKLRKALTNVINSFITDFDKMSEKNAQNKVHLPPIFTMISLYIEQYTELFINSHSSSSSSHSRDQATQKVPGQKNVEQG